MSRKRYSVKSYHCSSCGCFLSAGPEEDYRSLAYGESGYCETCGPLPKISIRKDGARGYLWALLLPDAAAHATSLDTEEHLLALPHGWKLSEPLAQRAAEDAAASPVASYSGVIAARIADIYIKRRRALRGGKQECSGPVEYLYREDETHGVVRHRILKRTKERVYFQIENDKGVPVGGPCAGKWRVRGNGSDTAFVNVKALEQGRPELNEIPAAWSDRVWGMLYTEENYRRKQARRAALAEVAACARS